MPPYNGGAIPARREVTGTTQLPLSRIKKMIQIDQDINACSSSASFVITLATELFVQYLAEQGHNVVKSERKPRRNIQYKDLANAVSRIDNLEFLVDVIPRTVPYKEIKSKKSAAGAANGEGAIESGQTTLDGKKTNGLNGLSVLDGSLLDGDDEDPNAQLEMEIRGRNAAAAASMNGPEGGDVEMR